MKIKATIAVNKINFELEIDGGNIQERDDFFLEIYRIINRNSFNGKDRL